LFFLFHFSSFFNNGKLAAAAPAANLFAQAEPAAFFNNGKPAAPAAAANLFAQPKPAAFLTTGSLLRRPPPRISSRRQNRQPFEQREACCAGRRRESLHAGRTGSATGAALNNKIKTPLLTLCRRKRKNRNGVSFCDSLASEGCG
jgi:hypothetical protein